jgi:hypothetical protein
MTSRTHAIRTLKLQPHIWKDKFEGNYCPIIIVEEDAKREYKSRVLAQEIYFPLQQWGIVKWKVSIIWCKILYLTIVYNILYYIPYTVK